MNMGMSHGNGGRAAQSHSTVGLEEDRSSNVLPAAGARLLPPQGCGRGRGSTYSRRRLRVMRASQSVETRKRPGCLNSIVLWHLTFVSMSSFRQRGTSARMSYASNFRRSRGVPRQSGIRALAASRALRCRRAATSHARGACGALQTRDVLCLSIAHVPSGACAATILVEICALNTAQLRSAEQQSRPTGCAWMIVLRFVISKQV